MVSNNTTYKTDYVINSIKSDMFYKKNYQNSISHYNDDNWCNQFISTQHREFEVVIVRNVKNMNNGFYIVDRGYTMYCLSPFIQNLISQIAKKERNKKKKIVKNDGFYLREKTYSKSIDKFFINYIKKNTILFYTYDEYVDEFNPFKPKPSNKNNYKSHTKSQHTVNGFWRNQPYGNRKNPQYKQKWIESFQKGGKIG